MIQDVIMKHEPTRKLADAIFKGSRREHIFKVYPLGAPITDHPAVFIISRRIIDNRGKGHHVAMCIGETDSTVAELKKHRRAKCVKDNSSNAICILREKDVTVRATIMDDIVANRTFACLRNQYEPKIEPNRKRSKSKSKSSSKIKKTNANIAPRTPAGKPVIPAAKRAATAKPGSRVSRSVDSDRRQHRLPKPKRSPAGKAKGRADLVSRSRKKTAA